MRLDAPDLRFSDAPQRLGGGFWAEMFILHLHNPPSGLPSDVVARIAPDPEKSAWESTVQSGAAAQGFHTPAILLTGTPDGLLGRAWALMDVAPGQPLLAGLSGPGALIRFPSLVRRLPDQLARITAELHAIDAAPIRSELEDLTGRSVGVERRLDRLADRAARAEDPLLIGAVSRLQDTQPEPITNVVCHGDIHPFNVLADGDQLTLVDWTAAQIADPSCDLAFTALLLGTPPLDAPKTLRPAINAAGRKLSQRFLSRYEYHSRSAIDPRRFDWHTTLHAVRILDEITERESRTTESRPGDTDSRPGDAVDIRQDHPWHALTPAMSQLVEQFTGSHL